MINKDKNFLSKARDIKENNSILEIREEISEKNNINQDDIDIAGLIVGDDLGEGSSREQAASSQKILNIYGNMAKTFATKRYRSNLINWGILPIISNEIDKLEEGDLLFIKDLKDKINNSYESFEIEIYGKNQKIIGNLGNMTDEEKEILKEGCLINYNRRAL